MELQRKSFWACSSSSGHGFSRNAVARNVSSSKSLLLLCVSTRTCTSDVPTEISMGEMCVPRTVRSSFFMMGLKGSPSSKLSSPLRAESRMASQSKSPFNGPISFCSSTKSRGELHRRGILEPFLEASFLLQRPFSTGHDPSIVPSPKCGS